MCVLPETETDFLMATGGDAGPAAAAAAPLVGEVDVWCPYLGWWRRVLPVSERDISLRTAWGLSVPAMRKQ